MNNLLANVIFLFSQLCGLASLFLQEIIVLLPLDLCSSYCVRVRILFIQIYTPLPGYFWSAIFLARSIMTYYLRHKIATRKRHPVPGLMTSDNFPRHTSRRRELTPTNHPQACTCTLAKPLPINNSFFYNNKVPALLQDQKLLVYFPQHLSLPNAQFQKQSPFCQNNCMDTRILEHTGVPVKSRWQLPTLLLSEETFKEKEVVGFSFCLNDMTCLINILYVPSFFLPTTENIPQKIIQIELDLK